MNSTAVTGQDLPSKKSKRGYCRYPDGSGLGFIIEDEIVFRQSSYKDKYFSAQLLRYDKDKDGHEIHCDEIRIGYYIKGKKPKRKGEWVWGQFCPFFPAADLKKLVDELTARKWI